MEITQNQIDLLKEKIGEIELIKIMPDAFKEKYNGDKIYVFKGIGVYYKLHRIGDKFAWISLNNSKCYANGVGTEQEMLDRADKDLFVFNNYKEFVEFLYSKL